MNYFQLLVNEEEEYFLEEDEEESINDTHNTISQDSHTSSGSLYRESDEVSRPLKKSTAFHDRDSLEEQVCGSKIAICY